MNVLSTARNLTAFKCQPKVILMLWILYQAYKICLIDLIENAKKIKLAHLIIGGNDIRPKKIINYEVVPIRLL